MPMHRMDLSQFHQPTARKATHEQILQARLNGSTPMLMTIRQTPPTTNTTSTHSHRHPHTRASDPFFMTLPMPRRPASDPFFTALPKLRKPAMMKIEKEESVSKRW